MIRIDKYSNGFLKLQIYGQNLNLILDFFIIAIFPVIDLGGDLMNLKLQLDYYGPLLKPHRCALGTIELFLYPYRI